MSPAGYEGFEILCDLYLVFLQTVLFLVIWHVFYRPERGKREAVFAAILALVNLFLRLYPGVPNWGRYAASAVVILAYMLRMYRSLMIGQICILFFYTVSFFLMTGILKKIVKKPFLMSWQDTVFLSVLNVIGSMLVWMVTDLLMVRIDEEIFCLFTQKKEMVWKIPMMAVLLCTGELSAVFIFRKYKELQSEREKHFVEKQQMKAMKRRLEEAENFYGGIRKVRHEMRNHMANIKGLVAGEKYGEAEKYIEKLDETIQELDYKFSTGNAVTDVIINDKYRRAVKSGIAFRVGFAYRETDTISAFDMGIVLDNLLDNAIEACEKIERGGTLYQSFDEKEESFFID